MQVLWKLCRCYIFFLANTYFTYTHLVKNRLNFKDYRIFFNTSKNSVIFMNYALFSANNGIYFRSMPTVIKNRREKKKIKSGFGYEFRISLHRFQFFLKWYVVLNKCKSGSVKLVMIRHFKFVSDLGGILISTDRIVK